MALTTVQLARMCAASLAADKNLAAYAQEYFGKAFSIQLGEDFRRPPAMEDAPFILVFADAVESQPLMNTHSLGLLVGINDDVWREHNAVQEMRGLVRLDALLVPIEKNLAFATQQCLRQEGTVQFELINFPLLLMQYDLTLTEKLPIGRR